MFKSSKTAGNYLAKELILVLLILDTVALEIFN